ncbi:MAG TPA: copper homeostasis periplasmic binding protein CopC [Roseomonas sp.]|jgi:hypothetical protein
MQRFSMGALVAMLGLATATPAFAHAHLSAAEPAAEASVATLPRMLRLHFTEALELAFSGVRVTGPDGAPLATGAASLAPDDAKTLIVPMPQTHATGPYLVEWHVLSTDSHTTHGSYRLTVTP